MRAGSARSQTLIRAIFYGVLAACVVVLTVDLHRLMPKVDAALGSVQAIETNTTRTEAEMSGLLNTARHVAMDERAAANRQLAAVENLTARSATLLDDADATVKHLDESATDIGRAASAARTRLGTIGATANDAIAKIAADTHDTLRAGQETLKAATADLADPSLKTGLEQIGPAVGNLAIAAKEAAGATADIHQVTTYEARQIMAPVSKLKAVALVIVRFTGKFLGF